MGKIIKIPSDKSTQYKLQFNDGRTFELTEHDFLLSGMLMDMRKTGAVSSGSCLPVEDYDSRPFELIRDIVNYVKKKNSKLFIKYLNNKEIRGHMNPGYIHIFKNYEPSDVIHAANLSAFMSMELPKRVLIWYIADYIRNNTSTVEDITKFLGATPLDKETCIQHGFDETDNFWEAHPDEFQAIFGKPHMKPTSSASN